MYQTDFHSSELFKFAMNLSLYSNITYLQLYSVNMQWYSLTQPPTHNLQHPYWLWIALGSFPSETLVKFKSWKVMVDWEGEGFVFFIEAIS